MVTLWRERHGLCKSHFVERNWYMFPAKIYPAEIFPRLCRPNILELCRRIKNQNRRPPGRCYSNMLRGRPADATQIQRVAVPAPHNGIPLKRFFSAIAIVKKLTRKSSIIFAGQPHLNPLLQATMLRSHPADTTQIQHRAVRMPCNSVALKRFYAAIAPSQPS